MKNSAPSSEFEDEDKCPSCGSPCDIHTDLDDNDECNECRDWIDIQSIPKEETKQENCCTPIGQIKRYVDCRGCDEKPEQESTEEPTPNIKRSDLFNEILSIVKQIPMANVEGDAMDARSCAYEVEQLFYKRQQETVKSSKFTMVEIQEKIDLVQSKLLEKFPNCQHTTQVLMWDDGTYRVQCRHGNGEKIHYFSFYKNELEYEEFDVRGRKNGCLVDKEGTEYFTRQYFDETQSRSKHIFTEEQVELIANEMVNWALDNVGNPNPESGKKFDEVLAKYKNK